MDSNKPQFGQSTRAFPYVISLTIIAICAVLSFVFIRHAISKFDHDSGLINELGRQRMLSQRITKDILVVNFRLSQTDASRRDLVKSSHRFDSINALLASGSYTHLLTNPEIKGDDSQVNILIRNIDSGAQQILPIARQFSQQPDDVDSTTRVRKIDHLLELERYYVSAMDKLVYRYADLSKDRVQRLYLTQGIFALLLLLVVVLELFLVFLPLNRKLKQFVAQINEERTSLNNVIEGTGAGTWSWDVESGEIKINERWADILGFKKSELVPFTLISWRGLVHPEDLPDAEYQIMQLSQGLAFEQTFRMKHKNGSWVPILARGKVFQSDGGRDRAGTVFGTYLDISGLKSVEDQLRLSESMFKSAFEGAPIGIALVGLDGKWLRVNSRIEEMFRYSSEELQQLTFADVTHPDDLAIGRSALVDLRTGKIDNCTFEKRYLTKDGQVIYTMLASASVKDEEGRPKFFVSQIVNINDLKSTEERLAKALSYTEAILESSTEIGLIGTDVDGMVNTYSNGAELILGYTSNELLNAFKPLVTIDASEYPLLRFEKIVDAPVDSATQSVRTFAESGNLKNQIASLQTKDGQLKSVLLSISGVEVQGSLVGYLMTIADISKLTRAEAEIRTLLQVASEQNERLKNFAHIVSHNLRSHSSSLTMIETLIKDEFASLYENEIFLMLEQAIRSLSETIEHLTDAIQINSHSKESFSRIHLNAVLANNCAILAVKAREAGVDIRINTPGDIFIVGIPAYVDSIVLNFISNAIKYRSPDRESYLNIAVGLEGRYVAIKFEDNGLGIDLAKNGRKIFGMYKTFHYHEDSRGIGLFITKTQIEALGGRVEVESEVNVGTVFKVYLPYENN